MATTEFDTQVAELRRWFESPRFAGIRRLHSAREVVEQRGTIRNDYTLARDRVIAREAAAVSARNAATLSRQMYEAGLADFQKVLETQRTQLTAEDSLATAQSAVLTTLIQLYKALGGGWSQAQESDRT